MLVTVITPIYNRASFLPDLFRSLCDQTFKDFEWIIVDDGSDDDVSSAVDRLPAAAFPVILLSKANGGKHTAVNVGVEKARGRLTLLLDSDDELPPTAIADIAEAYRSTNGSADIAGVCGYMAHRDGQVIGHPFVGGDFTEVELRYRLHVGGDMCEVFRTDILRRYPFPEVKGERFCPECLVWNRIARKYRLRVFPKVVYLRDYLDGGLTDNIVRIRMKSPIAAMMTYAEMTTLPIPLLQKAKAAINYWRFSCCLTEKHKREAASPIPSIAWYWKWVKPVGWAMHLVDTKKLKQK